MLNDALGIQREHRIPSAKSQFGGTAVGIVGSVVASIEALTNERDKTNEMVIELVDILRCALIDRLTVDYNTETATNILAGRIELPAGYPEWVSAAVARLSYQTE